MSTREERVTVVGGGYMGGGIAQTFAARGIPCTLVDDGPERSQQRVAQLLEEATRFAFDGLLSDERAATIIANLRPAESLEAALADATYVAEVVPERADLKKHVLATISALVPSDVIIGSNTSAIPIIELARSVLQPERFLGVHWMNPAPFVPGVEIIPSGATSSDVTEYVLALMRHIGKVATVVGDGPGFVANRLQYALFREAARIVEDGVAGPAEIDEVVRNSFGFRLPFFGPFAIADIAGLDVYQDGFATMERAFGERISKPAILAEQVDQSRFGLKNGHGFYEFDAEQAFAVARYRDRAYAGLNQLREDLGSVTLSHHELDGAVTD
jgi:3-hydroxybutyryl-CoA dehydrogenase